MKREKVFALINQERAYQDKKWGGHDSDNTLIPLDWLYFMVRYLNKGVDKFDDTEYQMIQIRKVAALAVAAMEYIDTPKREI